MKSITVIMLLFLLVFSLVGCNDDNDEKTEKLTSSNEVTSINVVEKESEATSESKNENTIEVDYKDEIEFEKSLKSGVDVTGKTVTFTVRNIHPESAFGHNLVSGEHLNFVSAEDPGAIVGQTVTVKIEKVETVLNSWILTYELLNIDTSLNSVVYSKESAILKDSGYSVIENEFGNYIYYSVAIENPNVDYAIEYPVIHIVCRNASGAILTTEDQTLGYIAATDTLIYANYIRCENGVPDIVELSVSNSDDNYELQVDSKYLTSDNFEVSNISVFEETADITGELTNNSTFDINDLFVSAVYYRNGQMIGGVTEYLDEIAAEQTIAFKIDGAKIANYDEIKVFASN